MTERTYRVAVEVTITTNMTAKEIKENTNIVVWNCRLSDRKVTVERLR